MKVFEPIPSTSDFFLYILFSLNFLALTSMNKIGVMNIDLRLKQPSDS